MSSTQRYGGFKVDASTTVNFRVDGNSSSIIYYNNTAIHQTSYSGPACDYVNGMAVLLLLQGGQIRMFDHTNFYIKQQPRTVAIFMVVILLMASTLLVLFVMTILEIYITFI